ncbi:MAG TPA: transposase [Lacibacter sp.]|jgi:REP element-mobilizing transposase RayT|nr:transposase [Lacibacter sp.]
MSFLENCLYHIYNRSINQQILFNDDQDYIRFLEMERKHLSPSCFILGWSLMPNHFHFLISTNQESLVMNKVGGLQLQSLQNAIRNLLSSYSKYYNYRYNRKGNLFQQKTKSKLVESDGYQVLCYIHQNPWKAKLVDKIEDWTYSSFRDFIGLRHGSLCNLVLARELLEIQEEYLFEETYKAVSVETINKLGLDE